MKLVASCERCGKEFTRSMSAKRAAARADYKSFCSMECRRNRATVRCAECGTEFECKAAYIRQDGANYCSRACVGRAKRGSSDRKARPGSMDLTWATCRTCKNLFRRAPSHQQRYCSQACYPRTHLKGRPKHAAWRAAISQSKRGKPNPILRKDGPPPFYGYNWPEQRRRARERDDHTCQDCGKVQRTPALDVHHIVPRREFGTDEGNANALSNLVTLCRTCHLRRERALDLARWRERMQNSLGRRWEAHA